MELWLICASITSISIGVSGYIIKVIADKNIEGGILSFMQGGVFFLFGLLQSLIFGWDILATQYIYVIGLASTIAILTFLNIRFRINALKYLSTSEYFTGYRILTTFVLLFIGGIFLGEAVNGHQLFGLLIGSIAIFLLFETNKKGHGSRKWSMAIYYLTMSILAGALMQVVRKAQGLTDFPYSSMFFYQGIIMLCISLLFDSKALKENFTSLKTVSRENKKTLFLAFCATSLVYLAASFNILSYKFGGNVSIVTKIMAYSLFVSILLAIVLKQEKMSYKKGIAFVLTIISIYYLN